MTTMIDRFCVPWLDKQERGIQVYLPQNYERTQRHYPVLYMHDGLNVFRDEDAIGGVSLGLESYLDDNNVEIVVVAIDSYPNERINEYRPWEYGEFSKSVLGDVPIAGGKGKEYVDFVTNHLKPFVDQTYRTYKGNSCMAGISLGRLIATYAAARYPTVFTRVAAISPAYYPNQESIEDFLRVADLSSIEKFYLDCGTREAGDSLSVCQQFLSSSEAIYEILQHKIPDIHFEVVNHATHSYSDFRKRVPQVLGFLLSDKHA